MAQRGAAIPRYRAFAGPAVFQEGFRPFFLGAGIWGLAAMALWLAQFGSGLALPIAWPASVWHGHEMVFGYLAAALAGFLLTAVPNWTGRMPLQGWPLILLAGLWLAGRLAMLTAASIGPWTAMALDLAFLTVFLAVIGREIAAGRNWRNLPVLGAVAGVLVANALVHLGGQGLVPADLGLRLGIGGFAVMIALIGGRIVPSFTRNWLVKHGAADRPASYARLDRAVLALTAMAMLAWAAAPASAVTAGLAGLAGAANVLRMARWCGHRTWREPLLLVLHVGYAWLPLGLLLIAAAAIVPGIGGTMALHALTAGAMGTMPLAVMTRASLGHTGRALAADGATTMVFILVVLAALLRVVAPALPAQMMALLTISGLVWMVAFGLFVAAYLPILTQPRRGRA